MTSPDQPAAPRAAHTIVTVVPNASRKCGTCTACCDGWLRATVLGREIGGGAPCVFRAGGGCTIYAERPEEPCRRFACGWLMPGSPFPESFRPDRLGVVIVPRRWGRNRLVYELVAAGRDPDDTLLAWMRNFSIAINVPFTYKPDAEDARIQGFGPTDFREDVRVGATLWAAMD